MSSLNTFGLTLAPPTATNNRTLATTTSPTTTTTNNNEERQTYWCHECDMSFSLLITTPLLIICPHCHGDFCEEMDSPLFPSTTTTTTTTPNPNPNFSSLPPPLHPHLPPFPTLSPPQTLTPTDDDDLDSFQIPSTIRLSDAYLLDRLIQHLTDPDDETNIHHTHHGSSPASKASVESIPTVKITSAFLNSDTMLCAVCKDEFVIDVEAKQLPCNHIYHFDCILPWLSMHNSCPVCRFCLPTEETRVSEMSGAGGGRATTRVAVRFGNLMDEEEEDMFGVGSTLRHIVRRHRLVFPTRSTAALGSSSSPTQMAQAETSSAGPANSGETVSSRPVEVGSRVGRGIGGSSRLDEDGDTVMSEVREGWFVD